jgi:GNAT superfamily N-acetyltransferase
LEEIMVPAVRPYQRETDYNRVGQLLIRTAGLSDTPVNWLQPRWEYMHFHPYLDTAGLGRIGIWEADGEIVGAAHYEHRLGDVYFQIDPAYGGLKSQMIDYAETHLTTPLDNNRTRLQLFINDFDTELEDMAKTNGYRQDVNRREETRVYDLSGTVPTVTVPEGFQLKSLAEDNDLQKIHRLLHRGFNHPGEPPTEELSGRELMQSAPNYRKDLTLVTEAPSGQFVSFCGMWYDEINRIAYVEPVATDPDYRFLGLGKAVVLEGVRRCADLGAKIAYVGSGQTFYRRLGFTKRFATTPWIKYLKP